MKFYTLIFFSLALLLLEISAEECGNANYTNGLCCSQFEWCGSKAYYCSPSKCQSQCTPPPASGGLVASVITEAIFNQMFKYRNDERCDSNGFYTYNAFISATKSFNGFGTTGNLTTRKRELAAFLAQTSHETTGGWESAPDGPYAWGYCYVIVRENNYQATYCFPTYQWPCASGKLYYGRGPFQLTYNYNYGEAGRAIGVDLLNNPNLVATDPVISFKTAIWFWMTPQRDELSSHNVMIGKWRPSDVDRAANRVPGYGVVTNIINGGIECGYGADAKVANRIGFYKRYCDILGVTYGDHLDCYNQRPFG